MDRRSLLLTGATLPAVGLFSRRLRAAEPISIADINSYTRMAAFTIPYRQGYELAIEELNAAGGVDGREVLVIFRDDAGEPGEAVKIAEEMVAREQVAFLTGGFFSNVGLALASFAEARQVLYIAGEPLADALVWSKGNAHTFRLRPSTYMQAAMLAEAAAKNPARRWATIAPNYAYGKEAVAAFKQIVGEQRPDVEWVAEQWPPLFGIDAGAELQALTRADPEAVYCVCFGPDLARFVREGSDRGFFESRFMVGLLTGEPEYLEPLGQDTPEGWLVTGYPWDKIETEAHDAFRERYRAKFDAHPYMGSLVGYNVGLTAAALLKATQGATATPALLTAMEGLTFQSPLGSVTYRPSDHQATMGTFVGYTTLEDGRGTMRDWYYADGARYLPPPELVRSWRPDS